MLPSTRLAYLSNTYLFNGVGTILSLLPTELTPYSKHGGHYIVLDETVFYPQGGGQPADIGTMALPQAQHDPVFYVKHVVLDGPSGQVHHIGDIRTPDLVPGQQLFLQVDADIRIRNARLHSAGHLLFGVVQKLGYPLVEKKGYHWEQGPYVEFDGMLPDSGPVTIQLLNQELSKAIDRPDAHIRAEYVTDDDRVEAPEGKAPRIVTINGFSGSPCGGTHVRNLAELGTVQVTKIRCRKNATKMNYIVIAPPAPSMTSNPSAS